MVFWLWNFTLLLVFKTTGYFEIYFLSTWFRIQSTLLLLKSLSEPVIIRLCVCSRTAWDSFLSIRHFVSRSFSCVWSAPVDSHRINKLLRLSRHTEKSYISNNRFLSKPFHFCIGFVVVSCIPVIGFLDLYLIYYMLLYKLTETMYMHRQTLRHV